MKADQTPHTAGDDGELVAEWMESLGFNWGKTLKVWTIDDKILKPWVTPEQAAFFYQQMLDARLDQMNYVDQRLIGKDTSGERVFYDKDAVIAENKLKAQQRVISDAMKAELKQGPTNAK